MVGHVAPEAYVGGPIALVKDGDKITIDIEAGSIMLDVSAIEIEKRRSQWSPPSPNYSSGALACITCGFCCKRGSYKSDFIDALYNKIRFYLPIFVAVNTDIVFRTFTTFGTFYSFCDVSNGTSSTGICSI